MILGGPSSTLYQQLQFQLGALASATPSLERAHATLHPRLWFLDRGETGERLQRVTAWSAWAEVECALLNRQDWTAIPISRSILGPPGNNPLRPFALRKSINLLSKFGPILQARLYVTALGSYRAYLNGKRVGDREIDPGWTSYSHHLAYQLFDVSS
jgi:alpha-L-rhamnosidase